MKPSLTLNTKVSISFRCKKKSVKSVVKSCQTGDQSVVVVVCSREGGEC